MYLPGAAAACVHKVLTQCSEAAAGLPSSTHKIRSTLAPTLPCFVQKRRVLLAEDNLINQAVARKMLTSLGMTCEVASNGEEAVQVGLTSPLPACCHLLTLHIMWKLA